MSRRDVIDVAVVGGGVVGTAAALAFARDGLDVVLIESREPAPWSADRPDLRVYAFAPDNAALLDSVGVWEPVRRARAQPYRAMRVWDAAGGSELAFDADAFGRPELGWIVEHGLLVDRLWQALPAAGVRLHCPDDVVGLAQDDTAATLDLASGQRVRARLVVAADGARSALRGLAGIGVDGRPYGQTGVVAYIESERPHAATCWQRFLPEGPVAVLPVADDASAAGAVERGRRSSIVWTMPDAQAARRETLDDTAFARELEQALGGRLGGLQLVSARAAFALQRQLAATQHAGRVVLVGDAAHVVHPLAGQGVNLGLRDVGALRATIRAARDAGADIASASRLARWARTRRSDNALAAGTFDAINRVFSNDGFLPTLLRGPVLGLGTRVPGLAHALWRHAAGR